MSLFVKRKLSEIAVAALFAKLFWMNFTKNIGKVISRCDTVKDGSPGLVVMGEDSYWRSRRVEYYHRIWDA